MKGMYPMKITSAAVALGAVGALALTGCSSGEHHVSVVQKLPHAVLTSGHVSSLSVPVTADKGSNAVVTPVGATSVLVGNLAPSGLDGKTVVQAPKGGSVLPIQWSTKANTGAISPGNHKATLVVTAGKTSWQISNDVTRGGKALISLPTNSMSKVSVAVVFDGLAQYVDPKTDAPIVAKDSPASTYYDGHSLVGRSSCPPIATGSPNTAGLAFTASCGYTTINRSPWLPDRGWASRGHQWVTAGVIFEPGTLTFRDASGKTAHYGTATVSLPYASTGNTGAVKISTKNAEKDIIFSAPAGTNVPMSLHQKYVAKASGTIPSDAPMQQTVTLDTTSTAVFDPSGSTAS